MHVVCVLPPPEHAPVEAAQLAVYADGWTEGAPQASRPPPSHSFLLPPGVASVEALALHVMRRLGVAARGPTPSRPASTSLRARGSRASRRCAWAYSIDHIDHMKMLPSDPEPELIYMCV